MTFKRLQIPLYFGLCILMIGSLFGIMHWGGRSGMLIPGLCLYGLFLLLAIIEMISSKKAQTSEKIIWVAVYLVVPVVSVLFSLTFLLFIPLLIPGSLYLSIVRKKFLFTRTIGEKIPFDILKDGNKD